LLRYRLVICHFQGEESGMNSSTATGQKATNQDSTPAAKAEGTIKGPLTGKDVPAPRKDGALPEKADKKAPGAFRTISEVADDLDVQQHVLRFWETKFSQIRPLKRGGGRRYYRPEDVALLKRVHYLLYTEGYTIKGVQKLLKEKGRAVLLQGELPAPQNGNVPSAPVEASAQAAPAAAKVQTSVSGSIGGLSSAQKSALEATLDDLKALRKLVRPE
jgi:DNA-binding transcriptional MerR regulator